MALTMIVFFGTPILAILKQIQNDLIPLVYSANRIHKNPRTQTKTDSREF